MGIHHASGSSSKIWLPISVKGNQVKTRVAEREHLKDLTPEQLAEIQSQKVQLVAASDLPEDDNDDDSCSWQDVADVARIDRILHGEETMEISYEGREFELVRDFQEKLTKKWRKLQQQDVWTHRNHMQQCVDVFKTLLELMTDAYMEWVLVRNAEKSPSAEEGGQPSDGIWVIDIFSTFVKIPPFNDVFHVMRELGCSDPDWRLKNCCAACTFELEGEE
ncbi:hypothetical protein ARMGADRAFT_1037031 [Armillaria gallica]|uniref:Uncharacterized protein n=1 Tax=Armillaria gallica TaxID=47427 RepID=A0A2H3DAM3_ARMGA|nr:hypothetical protein ARMGADRAFT_1037031 [Armillaria gallica]